MVVSLESWAGSGYNQTVSADITLKYALGRCQNLNVSTSGRRIFMPDAQTLPRGARLWILWNSGSQSATLRDSFGTSLGTLGTGQVAQIGLADNSTPMGTWIVLITSAF